MARSPRQPCAGASVRELFRGTPAGAACGQRRGKGTSASRRPHFLTRAGANGRWRELVVLVIGHGAASVKRAASGRLAALPRPGAGARVRATRGLGRGTHASAVDMDAVWVVGPLGCAPSSLMGRSCFAILYVRRWEEPQVATGCRHFPREARWPARASVRPLQS